MNSTEENTYYDLTDEELKNLLKSTYNIEKTKILEEIEFRENLAFSIENSELLEAVEILDTIFEENPLGDHSTDDVSGNTQMNSSNTIKTLLSNNLFYLLFGLVTLTVGGMWLMSEKDDLSTQKDSVEQASTKKTLYPPENLQYEITTLPVFYLYTSFEDNSPGKLGEEAYDRGDFTRARQKFELEKQVNPAPAHQKDMDLLIAVCYLKEKELAPALAILEELSEYVGYEGHVKAKFYLGILHYLQGDRTQANNYLTLEEVQTAILGLKNNKSMGQNARDYLDKNSGFERH